MTHICYVIWKFRTPKNFIGMGGAENQLLKMINVLKKKKEIKMTVLTKQSSNDPLNEKISEDNEIFRLNVLNIPILSMLLFMIIIFPKLIRINKRKKIDIIHIPLPDIFMFTIYIISRILGIPVIIRVASDELNPKNKGSLWFLAKLFVRKLMLKFDGI